MERKIYQAPTVHVVELQYRQALLDGSVIGPGAPNTPAAARRYKFDNDDCEWDEWDE